MIYIHDSNINPEAFARWSERTDKRIVLMAKQKNDLDLARYLMRLVRNKTKPLTQEQLEYIACCIGKHYPQFKERWKQIRALTEEIEDWQKELLSH